MSRRQATLHEFDEETPHDVIERVQEQASALIEGREVTWDV